MRTRPLLDANLSWRSVPLLKQHFEYCIHVDNTGMFAPAKNTEIWEYAGENDLLIVTCDEDFFNLSSVRGFPPEIIMLGTGNRGRRYIEQPLIKMKSRIEEFIASADYDIL